MLGVIVLGMAGCDALNPAFSSLVAPEVTATYATVPNPPGYVVLALQDNVTIDSKLLAYLSPKLGLTSAEENALRARIRMRLRITHVDGTFITVEMISGSGEFVDPDFNAQSLSDLNQNTLTNVVVPCDVASIQLEPGTNIEVFIPVPLERWELVDVGEGEQVELQAVLRGDPIPPQFQVILVDEVDEDENVILRRNVDPRDVPIPRTDVVCGSVVPVVVEGVLTVPFFSQSTTGNPGFDQEDDITIAGIGGRYQFRVSAQ